MGCIEQKKSHVGTNTTICRENIDSVYLIVIYLRRIARYIWSSSSQKLLVLYFKELHFKITATYFRAKELILSPLAHIKS